VAVAADAGYDRPVQAGVRAAGQRSPQTRERAAAGVPASGGRGTPAQVLALQRLAGNRVARRVAARWVKHPDPTKKGVMLPDVAAEELQRFNPPQNR
jgi:hypothetical protein